MRITVYELTEAQKTIIILLQRTLTLLPILLFHHRATPAYPPILIATLVQAWIFSCAPSLYSIYSCSKIVHFPRNQKTLLSSKTQASFVFSGRMPASCVELKNKENKKEARAMTDQLQLTADVCQLHNMVHTALRDALTALLTLDTTLAQEVREKEKEIDRTSIRLDEACIAWLNEHPSPSEVSRAVASVKIIAELERLGDYANNIAKMVRRRFCCYDMAPFENVLALIRLMMEHALSMLQDIMQAYGQADAELLLVSALHEKDNIVDQLCRDIYKEIIMAAMVHPWTLEAAIDLQIVVRFIERVADRTTNIAEWLHYAACGQRFQKEASGS